jgi:hypothetical protein
VAGFISAMRATFADLVGDAEITTTRMPDGLPAAVQSIADQGVALLTEYQGPAYAQLYLDRLRRFAGRRGVEEALFCDIARLMAMRMSYLDAIRIAQLKLAEAARSPGRTPADDVQRLRIDEVISSLPEIIADPALSCVEFARCSHMTVKMRFSAASWWSLRRLRIEAYMRRWRLLSVRYATERVWVERWLHMIDRALNKQPAAAAAVAETATLVQGCGSTYRHGLDNWNMIIDGLAKPTFDGVLQLTDLAGAITEARAVAQHDSQGGLLRARIKAIRATA